MNKKKIQQAQSAKEIASDKLLDAMDWWSTFAELAGLEQEEEFEEIYNQLFNLYNQIVDFELKT